MSILTKLLKLSKVEIIRFFFNCLEEQRKNLTIELFNQQMKKAWDIGNNSKNISDCNLPKEFCDQNNVPLEPYLIAWKQGRNS
jgi:hypothetical protein